MLFRFLICFAFSLANVLAGVSCNKQFHSNYLCASAGVARPMAQIGSSPSVEIYFDEAWTFFQYLIIQSQSVENGGFVAQPYWTLITTNGNNIPSDMDDISNPENCTMCSTDVFAPVGDTKTVDTVKAASVGWAFWNVFFITIWVASANVIFDSHCTGNCISYHPSRKNYFRAGIENIIAMAPPPINQTVYLFSNPSSASTDVITPLANALNSETYVEPFWVQMDTMDLLTAVDVQTYLSAAPENEGPTFTSASHPIDGVVVAAETGQVEPLLLGMSNQRPKRVLSMSTKILVDHDIPENTLDNGLFTTLGSQPNLQNCVMTPTLRITSLSQLSRQWLWDISTASQRNGWQGSSPSLLGTWRYQFVQSALTAITSHVIDIPGQPRDAWMTGYATAQQLVGDAREDQSYLHYGLDPRTQASGIIGLVYGGMIRIWFLADHHVRYRIQNMVQDCATMAFFTRIIRGLGLVRRHIQNPFYWASTSRAFAGGTVPPPPEFPFAEDCYNPMGVIVNDPQTGENSMGMYLTQMNSGNTQHVVLPVYPLLYPSESIMETEECVPIPATTTLQQTTEIPRSESSVLRYLSMCTISLVFWM